MKNIDRLSIYNMDVYFPLNQKRDLIKKISSHYFNGRLLDLGCGTMPYRDFIFENSNVKEYIGVDIENPIYQKVVKPNVFWDGVTIPLEKDSFENALLIEVLEHIPNPTNTLQEINKVLKKDGHLLITIPYLWPLHDVPNDEFRYTPFAIKRMLTESGFQIIHLESFNNWHGSMASMLALYVKRGLVTKHKKIIARLTLPIVNYLMKKDLKSNKRDFVEGQMITGIWCLAKKI